MNKKSLGFGVGIALLLACCATAWAVDKERIGAGGLWDEPDMWDPNGVPQAGDICFHREQASDILRFDGFGAGHAPAGFSFTPGGNPPRAFLVESGLAEPFQVDWMWQSAPGDYGITLVPFAVVSVFDGGIYWGDWTLEEGAQVDVVSGGVNLEHGSWVIGGGAVLQEGFDGIWGHYDDSQITLAGQGSGVTSIGTINVAYLTANPGSLVDCGHFVPIRWASISGSTLGADRVTIGALYDSWFRRLILSYGSVLDALVNVTIRRKAALQYGGQANSLDTRDFLIEAVDGLLQPAGNHETNTLDLTFAGSCLVQTDADHFSGWDASGVTLFGGGGSDADSEEFTGSIQDLTDWAWSHLDAPSRLAFADRLDEVVASGDAGDQGAQTAALAQLLR